MAAEISDTFGRLRISSTFPWETMGEGKDFLDHMYSSALREIVDSNDMMHCKLDNKRFVIGPIQELKILRERLNGFRTENKCEILTTMLEVLGSIDESHITQSTK